MKDHNFDLILLQETHSTSSCEKYWRAEWGHPICYAHGTSESRGCAILLSGSLQEIKINDIKRDINGRYIIMKIELNKETYAFACIYAPNEDDPSYFSTVFQQIEKMKADHLIIGGDFNTILSNKDIKGGRGHTHSKCTSLINDYIETLGIVDIWRNRNEEKFRYTFFRHKPYPIMERIDYILVSFQLQQKIFCCDIQPSYLSDHGIPTIILKIENNLARGKGRWMLNTSHLDDANYVDPTCSMIIETIDRNDMTPKQKWEYIKMMAQGESIKHGSRKNKSSINKLAALEKKLYDLENRQTSDLSIFTDNDFKKQITLIRKDIEQIRHYKTEGAITRSRTSWVEHGEKISKYFFNLEKIAL